MVASTPTTTNPAPRRPGSSQKVGPRDPSSTPGDGCDPLHHEGRDQRPTRTGRALRCAALVALGIIAIGIALYWLSPHRAHVGHTYTLEGSYYAAVPLARDPATAAEIQQLAPSFRWLRVQRLVDADRAVMVNHRDRIEVTELALFEGTGFARVVVLGGDDPGKAGWVPETLLHR